MAVLPRERKENNSGVKCKENTGKSQCQLREKERAPESLVPEAIAAAAEAEAHSTVKSSKFRLGLLDLPSLSSLGRSISQFLKSLSFAFRAGDNNAQDAAPSPFLRICPLIYFAFPGSSLSLGGAAVSQSEIYRRAVDHILCLSPRPKVRFENNKNPRIFTTPSKSSILRQYSPHTPDAP